MQDSGQLWKERRLQTLVAIREYLGYACVYVLICTDYSYEAARNRIAQFNDDLAAEQRDRQEPVQECMSPHRLKVALRLDSLH